MELVKRDRGDLVETLRRFMGMDLEQGWLRIEEFVDDGTLVVRAELPGIDPDEDVDISVVGGVLRISAEREERTENKDKGSYRSEFHYGTFTRDITLPEGCRESDITATYADGVLEVRVPVGQASAPERVTIPVTRA